MIWRRGLRKSMPGCSGCSKAWWCCFPNEETWWRPRAFGSGRRRCRRKGRTRRTRTTSVERRGSRFPKSGRARDAEERDGADAAGGCRRRGGGAYPERKQRRGTRGRGGRTLGVAIVAGRVADAVVTGGTWPGRIPVVVVVDAAGGGVNNADADADARPGVATSVRIRITASVGVAASVVAAVSGGVAASVAVATATAVTDAPTATRADAAAEARDATSSSWPDAASGNAAAGSVGTERRGVDGGIRGGQPAVVGAADGVGTPAEAAGDRRGVREGGRRNGGAPIG